MGAQTAQTNKLEKHRFLNYKIAYYFALERDHKCELIFFIIRVVIFSF